MSVPSRFRRASALVKFLPLLGFGSTPAQAADRTWQNSLPQGNPLAGVWADSGSDVFAAASAGTIRHDDGSGWSAMGSGTSHLNAVEPAAR